MALATTCPKCKTSFKVVPDQLKLRRGLVRCGVCQHVFSGIDFLRYVSDPRPTPTPTVAKRPDDPVDDDLKTAFFLPDTVIGSERAPGDTREFSAPAMEFAPASRRHEPVDDSALEDEPPESAALERDVEPVATPAEADPPGRAFAHEEAPVGIDEPDERTEVELRGNDALETEIIVSESAIRSDVVADDTRGVFDAIPGGAFALPAQRERSLRTASPLTWIAAAMLALLLVVQLIIGARDTLAARMPGTRTWLEAMVAPLGLQIELPREPSNVTIESFELVGDGRPGIYVLNALLRNRAEHPVRWPAIELTLTDSVGAVLVRKVLEPAQFLPEADAQLGFSGQTEKPVKLDIEVRELAPSGYKAILFYP